MTGPERSELAALREEIAAVREDVAEIKAQVDRWDGALRFVKAASSFVGFGGLLLIIRALVA